MLARAAEKRPIWALGAMSGTSLDGVDAALLQTDGTAIFGFGETGYRAYRSDERAQIRAGFGTWHGDEKARRAALVVEQAHAELLAQFSGAEILGFHGQTLAHDPGGRGTHQVGDGAVLAEFLRLPVVSDFRTSDVAMGGQGAPLAPFYHFALAQWINAPAPLAFLNLGGVGNLTWVDPQCDSPDTPGALLAFDTGPANAPINDLLAARLGRDFDQDGALAAAGHADEAVVSDFLNHMYFNKIPPKSLDRDTFAGLLEAVADHTNADAAATLVACSMDAVARGIAHCPTPPERLLVCGGGRRNQAMMRRLRGALHCPVEAVEAVGLNGDMLEAQAFAFLAVRVLYGLPTSAPGTTGVAAAIGGGALHNPARTGQNRPEPN